MPITDKMFEATLKCPTLSVGSATLSVAWMVQW